MAGRRGPCASAPNPLTREGAQAGKVLGYALKAADSEGAILLFKQAGYWRARADRSEVLELSDFLRNSA